MFEAVKQGLGLARSLAIYYGQPWRNARRRAFYGQFVTPGSVCFDVGSHVGDRVGTFRQLGARVVALEPQPLFTRALEVLYGDDEGVIINPSAVGREAGRATLFSSSRTPTVSSVSRDWIDEVVHRDSRFRAVRWDQQVEVAVTTLDALIAAHGVPSFCKIDVEGFELDVLLGLTQALPALSFEYLPAAKERAMACVARLEALGPYEFRRSEVETTTWATPAWVDGHAVRAQLDALELLGGSGDVYARLRHG